MSYQPQVPGQGPAREPYDRERSRTRTEKVLADAERIAEKRKGPAGRRGGVAGLLRRLRGSDSDPS